MSLEELRFLVSIKSQILDVAVDLKNISVEEAVKRLVEISQQIEC